MHIFFCCRSHLTVPELDIVLESCPLLCEIDLGFCDGLSPLLLSRLVEGCPGLRSINVEGCREIGEASVAILARCTRLTHLNFSHCTNLQVGITNGVHG